MHALILASLLLASEGTDTLALEPTASTPPQLLAEQTPPVDNKAEYDKRKKEAEGDKDKLWKLYDWCESNNMKNEARSTLRAILKLDPDSKQAHELLGHVEFEGKWYESQKKVDEYKKKQLDAEAKASGKVIYKGQLVDPADIPYLEKGMTKDAAGNWVDTETQKKLAEGWVKQDGAWIPPAEAGNLAKGLWKCDDKWLSLDEANKYHAEVVHWWIIPSEHFVLYSTCARKVAESGLKNCELAYSELNRLFGKAPQMAIPVVMLHSPDLYGQFANGEAGITPVEGRLGRSSCHGAFLAEALATFASNGQTLPGVTYWDASDDRGNRFGEMMIRHAAGLSFGEAIDQSPKAVAKLLKGEVGDTYETAFWSEKAIPQWLRYGAAAYVERYMLDSLVEANGNPHWRRDWAVTNITSKGGLDSFDKLYKFEIGPDNENSAKLISEAGLLVAFALDGGCADVQAKLGAFKEALKNNKDVPKAAQALADEIKKNEAKLRTFAQM